MMCDGDYEASCFLCGFGNPTATAECIKYGTNKKNKIRVFLDLDVSPTLIQLSSSAV